MNEMTFDIEQKPVLSAHFKTWVENSSIFTAMVEGVRYGGGLTIEYGAFSLKLNGTPISKAEELPPEILKYFYENYPENPKNKVQY